jgi:predicted DNA binding protein
MNKVRAAAPAEAGRRRGAEGGTADADPLAIMRVEFEVPRGVWLRNFTRSFPDLLVEVHNTLALDGSKTLGEFEVYGPPGDWTQEIRRHPDVEQAERLVVFPDLGRYRVLFHRPVHLAIARDLEVLLSYPRSVRGGIFSCETVARRSKLRALIAALNGAGCRARVVSFRRDSLRSVRPELSPVQRRLFHAALEAGYFEVPRRISLTRLAERLGRSKSTVSQTLAHVERKLILSSSANEVAVPGSRRTGVRPRSAASRP